MNNRIKELAEQAGITTNIDTDYFQKDPNKWVDYFSERLAELIIKECADVCDLLLDHKISSEWSRGTHDCSKAIQKHFGL